ncbi:MAG TPA: ElyC/SanA/YdcF family protein [Candidatus Udaeobacter sp.]|nr:ElyC/SanA/YdcF family protein [Candidatus Udaeobacter sp.]
MECNVLVVEGWVHDYVIQAAAKEFSSGKYQRVFSTGGPSAGNGGYTWDPDTSASVGAGQLRAAGVPQTSVQMVPSHVIGRDRTYYSAIALRDWFRAHQMRVDAFNIVTESTHSRRTWFLFQKAFGDKVKVGVIAIQNPDYDPKRWWQSSDGVREVVDETVAYVYARVFFHPDKGR